MSKKERFFGRKVVECRWVFFVERKLLDGLRDRLRQGRVVLPSVVTDLTPQMQLQGLGCLSLQSRGLSGSWRGLQGGLAYRRRRTIYGPQAAILEVEGGWVGLRVGSGHGLKHHRPVFLTEPTVQE